MNERHSRRPPWPVALTPVVRSHGALFLALLVAVVAAVPLFAGPGLLNTRGGGDSPFLLQRLHQLSAALADGHFPARWMPDANYGYGYPFFHYYAPLSLYVAVLFRLLGAGYVAAIQLAQLVGFLVAAAAAFALGRRWLGGDAVGLLVSAAYTVAPFHLVNVYVRGDSLAEFWAMALYPLVLLAADRLLADERRWPVAAIAALAVSYAALILSHNISALIFSPFLLLLLAVRLLGHPTPRRALIHAVLALGWGLALSAWFWLPALAETGLAQTEPITSGYFHYANHFRGTDLVQPSLLFSYDVSGGGAFRMGLLQALLIVAGLAVLLLALARKGWLAASGGSGGSRIRLFLLLGLLLATAMITPLSRPLWDHLPLLPYTQFPWRFLSVQAFFGALVAGYLARLPHRRWWLPPLLLMMLVAALAALRPAYLPLADEDVAPERLAEYEWFTGNIGTTVSAEYLPQTVQPRPFSSGWLSWDERDRPHVLQGEATATLLDRKATAQRWQTSAGPPGATLLLPTLYWPGWQATLDGEALPISAAAGSGLISVEVPAGEHRLEIRLGRTPLRLGAELLSLLALLALLPVAWLLRRSLGPPLLGALGASLLLAIVLALLPAPHLDAGTLTWDFAQAGYLHHAPDGILFADGSRLLLYEYEEETAGAGQSWSLLLYWAHDATGDARVAVDLVTPAANRFPAAPVLAGAASVVRPGPQRITLAIPDGAPPGLYVPRLTVEGAVALLANGETRGDLYLRPLRVAPAGRRLPPPETALAVHPYEVRLEGGPPAAGGDPPGLFDCATAPAGAPRLLLHLAWYTADPLPANLLVSLRLGDAQGRELARCDLQPGYGYQPSLAWAPGEWTADLLALPLPSELPDAAPYTLSAHLYDGAGQGWLTQRLGTLDWQEGTLQFRESEPVYTLPPELSPADARFGEMAALRGYTLAPITGDLLTLTLYWEALGSARESYVRFVQLLGPDGQIVQRGDGSTVQADGLPQGNSYPTSQWSAGEIVAETVQLDLAGVPAGDYELAIGFYPPGDASARLPVTLSGGEAPADRLFRLPVSLP